MRYKKGVLVTSPPDLLYFEDVNGDGKADTREVVLTGFAKTNPQQRGQSPGLRPRQLDLPGALGRDPSRSSTATCSATRART